MSSFTVPPHDATSPAPLDYERRMTARSPLGLNLFWRTFCLLALLLVGSILAWLQTLRALEFEPRTLHTAQGAFDCQAFRDNGGALLACKVHGRGRTL